MNKEAQCSSVERAEPAQVSDLQRDTLRNDFPVVAPLLLDGLSRNERLELTLFSRHLV